MSAKQFTEMMRTDSDDIWSEPGASSGGLMPGKDPAINPAYYVKDGLECYDVQRASVGLTKFQGYLECCAQKYLWRWEDKNGKQDLEKAVEYLVKLIETLE
jgi:hypothetical protein